MPLVSDVTPAKLVTLATLVILLIFLITKLYILNQYTTVEFVLVG